MISKLCCVYVTYRVIQVHVCTCNPRITSYRLQQMACKDMREGWQLKSMTSDCRTPSRHGYEATTRSHSPDTEREVVGTYAGLAASTCFSLDLPWLRRLMTHTTATTTTKMMMMTATTMPPIAPAARPPSSSSSPETRDHNKLLTVVQQLQVQLIG